MALAPPALKVDPLGESVATTAPPQNDVLGSTLASTATPPVDGQRHGLAAASGRAYPRVITPYELLLDCDDKPDFCGPPSEPDLDRGPLQGRDLAVWGLMEPRASPPRRGAGAGGSAAASGRGLLGAAGGGDGLAAAIAEGLVPEAPGLVRGSAAAGADEVRGELRGSAAGDAAGPGGDGGPEGSKKSGTQEPSGPLILPRGEIAGDLQKFICVFQIGLEDDQEFCLVKRILGKAGNNMRRIAEECAAKVRLRGIGSGFLEGSDGKEANMPLQLNVSCTDYSNYAQAVDRVATLLKDLYKHYRRYARSKGMEPPDVKINLEEVRRDDLNLDLLSVKAARSPSQRERDRRARDQEKRLAREREREREQQLQQSQRHAPAGAEQLGGRGNNAPLPAGLRTDQPKAEGGGEGAEAKAPGAVPLTLPGGLPVPTTAAGRRAAARAGGAQAAAIASAAAREADRLERERLREARERQRDQERMDRERRKGGSKGGKGKALPPGSVPPGGLADPRNGQAQGVQPPLPGAKGGKGKGKEKGALPFPVAVVPLKAPPPPPPEGPPPADAVEAVALAAKHGGKW